MYKENVNFYRLSILMVMMNVLDTLPVSACSGPRALETIERAEFMGWILFGLSAGMFVIGYYVFCRIDKAIWYTGNRLYLWILLLVFIHPGWWLSARTGDCGVLRLSSSILVTVITLLVIGFVIITHKLWEKKQQCDSLNDQSSCP